MGYEARFTVDDLEQPPGDTREPLLSDEAVKAAELHAQTRKERGRRTARRAFLAGASWQRDRYEAQRTRDVQELESLRAMKARAEEVASRTVGWTTTYAGQAAKFILEGESQGEGSRDE